MTHVTVFVDNEPIEVEEGITVLQACEKTGVEIPRFCYHDRLKIAGNCRMCLVEVHPGPPKPAASCAMPVAEGMKIFTNTEMVKKAREGVMEFLLANHPLDCPICDQGGECDLQDQAYLYGKGKSRYNEEKRAVVNKYMGPLVKTEMTRCIHCTRCIRFSTEVAGVEEMGAIDRGENMEIISYLDKALTSELSGNVIDLCPVGALTAKPYAYKERSWELSHTESIDVMDAVGSNIVVHSRGMEVLRILPRINEEVNEEWISDKTRFAFDGLKVQRIDRGYIRNGTRLQEVSTQDAIRSAANLIKNHKPNEIAILLGDLVDFETAYTAKKLADKLGITNIESRQDGAKIDTKSRGNYLFNTTISGIDEADLILIVNTNIRLDAPIINARIRKRYLDSGKLLKVYQIGNEYDLKYPTTFLHAKSNILNEIATGKHKISKAIEQANKPIILIGQDAITGEHGGAIHAAALTIAEKYMNPKWKNTGKNAFNMLHKVAGRVGALEAGCVSEDGIDQILNKCQSGKIKLVYAIGADEIPLEKFGKAKIIYQGSHGDQIAEYTDVIIPTTSYTEKNALYINTEGRLQETSQAVKAPGDAINDWEAINSIGGQVISGNTLVENHNALRQEITLSFPHLQLDQATPGEISSPTNSTIKLSEEWKEVNYNFYMTNPICRSSVTMAKCTNEILES